MKAPSPLLGFNNNVRHKGRVFHIQTEDSGIRHPHIITHLFADGGRILKTTKTSYAEHIGAERLAETVRAMMQEQHKAMFIALRDGQFDYLFDENAAPGSTRVASRGAAPAAPPSQTASAEPAPIAEAPKPAPAAEAPKPPPPVVAEAPPPPDPVPPPAPPPDPVKPVAAPAPPPEPPARPPAIVVPGPRPVVVPPPAAFSSAEPLRPPSTPDDAPLPPRPTVPKPEAARPIVVPRPTAGAGAVPAHFAPTQPAQPAVAAAPVVAEAEEAARPEVAMPSQASRKRGVSRPTLDVDPGAIHGVGPSDEPSIDLDLDALERAAAEAQTPFFQQIQDLPPPPASVLGKQRGGAGGYSVRSPAPPPPAAAGNHRAHDSAPRPAGAPLPPLPREPAAPPPAVAPSPGRYAPSRPASIFANSRPQEGASIFGEDLISEKSLDEVILGYLAEDLDGPAEKK